MKIGIKNLCQKLAGGAAIVLVLSLTLLANKANADLQTGWLGGGTAVLEKVFDLPRGHPISRSNQDCHELEYKVTFLTHDSRCFISTTYGEMSYDSGQTILVPNNSSYGGSVLYQGPSPYSPSIGGPRPIQNSSVVMYGYNAALNNYLLLDSLTPSKLSVSKALNKSVTFKINDLPEYRLEDKANHALPVNFESIGSSGDGSWLILDSPFKGILRVNLATFDILPFAPSLSKISDRYPSNIYTAITNDGRYAAIAKNSDYFRIYDLSTCTGTVSDTLTDPLSCQYRNLAPDLNAQLNSVAAITNVRFINDHTVSFFARYNFDNSSSPATFDDGKFTLTTSDSIADNGSGDSGSSINNRHTSVAYLAMGDSFSSGEGVFDYLPFTDSSENLCHLSQHSYPFILGGLFQLGATRSVACSGAKLIDILSESNLYKGQEGRVVDLQERRTRNNTDDILNNFKPGYISQTEFLSQYRPKVVTLTGGGNDVDFAGIVKTCTTSADTCYDTYEDRAELVLSINRSYSQLVQTYQKIKELAAPNALIYVLAYPELAQDGGDCALNVHLSSAEIKFSNQLIKYLDSVIEKAAHRAGIGFADTRTAFYGHRLCEAKNHGLAVNGLTAGNDILRIIGNESYHPNALGHEILRNVTDRLTLHLTAGMPEEYTAEVPPPLDIDDLGPIDILNDLPVTGRQISQLSNDQNMLPDFLQRGQSSTVTALGSLSGLAPNNNYTVEIHSDPVSLGVFTSDSNGDLDFDITIPSSIEPGYHTIHILGSNLSGDQVDIYKTIYIAANANDYDGDGVSNNNDRCLMADSGIDADQDGLDDACDDEVEPAILISAAQPSPSTNGPTSNTQTSLVDNQMPETDKSVLDAIKDNTIGHASLTSQFASETDGSNHFSNIKQVAYIIGLMLVVFAVMALLFA